MVKNFPHLFFLLTLLSFTGCIPFKKIVLFQKDTQKQDTDSVYVNQDYEFVIAPFDLLSVRVTSTVEDVAKSVQVFNPPVTGAAAGTATVGINPYLQGTLVDKNGDIVIPYAGKVRVAGLTLAQASDTIRYRLATYIQDVDRNLLVTVKILNFNVNVLGEVMKQGLVQAENEYMTVTEVLAKAGGITDFGNRQKIKLIRTDRLTKKTTTYRIDLTTDEAVSPMLARLQPSDVIYVEPLRRKQFGSAAQILGLISTIISIPLLIVGIYNTIRLLR